MIGYIIETGKFKEMDVLANNTIVPLLETLLKHS